MSENLLLSNKHQIVIITKQDCLFDFFQLGMLNLHQIWKEDCGVPLLQQGDSKFLKWEK